MDCQGKGEEGGGDASDEEATEIGLRRQPERCTEVASKEAGRTTLGTKFIQVVYNSSPNLKCTKFTNGMSDLQTCYNAPGRGAKRKH